MGGGSSGVIASIQLISLSHDVTRAPPLLFPSPRHWEAGISGPSCFLTESCPTEELQGSVRKTKIVEEHELQFLD